MHYALISFLNARPLWWGLVDQPAAGDSFEFSSPAACADLLASGRAGLGLIPAIELARIPDLEIIPGLCIASKTEVRSVLLISRVPFEKIRSVALDPSSRTSVTLARILLGERLGAERYAAIKFDAVEPERLLNLDGHDAAVVIGDPALRISKMRLPGVEYRYDLVSEWNAMFDEPFVFALWAGRREQLRDVDALTGKLRASLAYGMREINTIASEASEELSIPEEELLDYFHSALHYDFGPRERAGLARFYQLAEKYRLIEGTKELSWLQTTHSASAKY